MKRPTLLTIWLIVMTILSVCITSDSLTYFPFILLTKNYISLFGIVAGFVQIWALIQLFRWKKIGFPLLISSAIVIFLITGVNEFNIVSNISKIVVSMLVVLVVDIIILGILYLAVRPVWKNFK